MDRVIRRVALGVTSAAIVAAIGVSPALAVSKTRYYAVAGNFATKAGATALQAQLSSTGWKSYHVEKEKTGKKGRYQVERSFTTKAAAMTEVSKLKAAKHHGAVETDKGGI